MKKIMTLLLFTLSFAFSPKAQVSFRLSAGFSPAQNPANADLFLNKNSLIDQFYFNMTSIRPQYFLGACLQNSFSKSAFFTEAKLLFTRRHCTYSCLYTTPTVYHPEPFMEMQETAYLLLLPLNVGVNLGPIAISSGMNAGVSITGSSELHHMPGYQESNSIVSLGWQSSVRLPLDKLVVGIEYQSHLSRTGEGSTLHDQSLALRNVPGQLILICEFIL